MLVVVGNGGEPPLRSLLQIGDQRGLAAPRQKSRGLVCCLALFNIPPAEGSNLMHYF